LLVLLFVAGIGCTQPVHIPVKFLYEEPNLPEGATAILKLADTDDGTRLTGVDNLAPPWRDIRSWEGVRPLRLAPGRHTVEISFYSEMRYWTERQCSVAFNARANETYLLRSNVMMNWTLWQGEVVEATSGTIVAHCGQPPENLFETK
jgi:hypothetical protein